MNIRILLLILCLSILTANSTIQRYKAAESITIETHEVLPGESMTVAGFIYQRYMTSEWFWGGAAYGAVLGQRGGYFIGGFLAGYTHRVGSWCIEPQLYIGAGGGHSAPAGMSSGGLVRPSIAIGYRIGPSLWLKAHLGHINFIQGTINSWLIGFSVGSEYYEIYRI